VATPDSPCTTTSTCSSTCRNWRKGITAIALIGSLVFAAAPAHAQLVSTAVPAVTVYGAGEASAPAASASVQLIIGQGDREFGFDQDESGGGSWESASSDEDGFVVEAGDSDDVSVTEGRGRNRRGAAESITAEQLAPIVDAVAAFAGLTTDAIKTNLSPLATEPFARPAKKARLDFEVDQPTPEGLTALITAASDAAAANGLVVEIAGVRYDPADCAAIEDQAAQAAIADAEARAERLAPLLGVTLGGVVAASSDLFSANLDFEEDGGCGGQISYAYDSRDGGIGRSLPVFDPAQPAEVTVASALTVAYQIVGNDTE
jgi:hypothetical protein